MPEIKLTTLQNGLPLYRIPVAGTQSLTLLIAFDAGARTELPEENGMAHFLEHLVFKGGVEYPTYRDVNGAAERAGAVLNAYTSHDLVAFHITARANQAMAATDLLTDFVARPKLDAEELDRERGVVIQEINRYDDQPSSVAEHLIDRAVFGDHPLGRSVLGTVEHLGKTFTREGTVAFRERRWAPASGAAFVVGNLSGIESDAEFEALFDRFPVHPTPEPYNPAPPLTGQVMVTERDSKQSHLRISYRPGIDIHDPAARAALTIYTTLLGGSMGSRLFDEIREQRGLAYSVSAAPHVYADTAVMQLSAGLESAKVDEAFSRMCGIVDELREHGPTDEEVERARAFAAGARAIAFESTNAIARTSAQQAIVLHQDVNPDAVISALDAVTFDEVAEVARAISEVHAVACVGPHTVAEFQAA